MPDFGKVVPELIGRHFLNQIISLEIQVSFAYFLHLLVSNGVFEKIHVGKIPQITIGNQHILPAIIIQIGH
jgi:hypothetical protein